jgi:hypothetical protein
VDWEAKSTFVRVSCCAFEERMSSKGDSMMRGLKLLAAAGFLAMSASMASAAPSGMGDAGATVADGLTKVHGCNRRCVRGRNGWHRHVGPNCVRRECRPWRGQGRRPDSCVKFGPVWYCEY